MALCLSANGKILPAKGKDSFSWRYKYSKEIKVVFLALPPTTCVTLNKHLGQNFQKHPLMIWSISGLIYHRAEPLEFLFSNFPKKAEILGWKALISIRAITALLFPLWNQLPATQIFIQSYSLRAWSKHTWKLMKASWVVLASLSFYTSLCDLAS